MPCGILLPLKPRTSKRKVMSEKELNDTRFRHRKRLEEREAREPLQLFEALRGRLKILVAENLTTPRDANIYVLMEFKRLMGAGLMNHSDMKARRERMKASLDGYSSLREGEIAAILEDVEQKLRDRFSRYPHADSVFQRGGFYFYKEATVGREGISLLALRFVQDCVLETHGF